MTHKSTWASLHNNNATVIRRQYWFKIIWTSSRSNRRPRTFPLTTYYYVTTVLNVQDPGPNYVNMRLSLIPNESKRKPQLHCNTSWSGERLPCCNIHEDGKMCINNILTTFYYQCCPTKSTKASPAHIWNATHTWEKLIDRQLSVSLISPSYEKQI